MTFSLRPITPVDNTETAQVIKTVLAEFGCVGPGFASSDPELNDLHSAYQHNGKFWVLVDSDEKIVGCGGYSQLKGTLTEDKTCEMQKFYFFPKARGGGWGRKLVDKILTEATKEGFETIYIETVPQMTNAVGFYKKLGFTLLKSALGNTGHHGCTIHMAKTLSQLL